MRLNRKALTLMVISALGPACGGGSGATAPPAAPTLGLAVDIKQLQFSWTAAAGASHYRLYENADGASGFMQAGSDINATSTTLDIAVHRHDWANARYIVEACNGVGCTASNEINTVGAVLEAIGYLKASNTDLDEDDQFGFSIAISNNGDTLAVGSLDEDSAATGIDGDQSDNSSLGAGAAYVYANNRGGWSQQAYVKASNTQDFDNFGASIALSGDGDTLAVGAIGEASNATGIDGAESDNSAFNAGAVYVYVRSGGVWAQQAYVKASNTGSGDRFGFAVALSEDGNTLAVGAVGEDSAATGIDGTESSDNSAFSAGAVYVYVRSGGVWAQQAYVKASNTGSGDRFGYAVAMSDDGNMLAVGARSEESAATGVDGDQTNNDAAEAGAVYVYGRNGGTWAQEAYVKASNAQAQDAFGISVALSGDGTSLAVGATGEDSAATAIEGDQSNNDAAEAGAVYVFSHHGGMWAQEAYVKAGNTDASDLFGFPIALSRDGGTLLVGATQEDGSAAGINGNGLENSALDAGAAYLYVRNGGVWAQQAYVKASNTGSGDRFGVSVGLTASGDSLAVGADREASIATGIDGDQFDDSGRDAGAVYLY